jgi:non-specific serine/threonine protein kinase
MPLAIELAAARAQVLTPTQMLSQLGKRFEFLVSRKRGVTERQRTLRAAIDWSYRLLPTELQQFFAGLSVFRSGWTAEAAEAVTGEPLALDYLAQLRECSLVLADDTGQEMRFRMLDTLREYAGEKLTEAGAVPAVRQRHAEFFLRFVEEGQGIEQPGWLDRLDIENDNLRAALDYCLQDDSEAGAARVELALRLAGLLWRFWLRRGHWSEARRRLAAVLERTQNAAPTKVRAEALAGAGEFAYAQSDYAAAEDYWKQRLDVLKCAGWATRKPSPMPCGH